MANTLNAQTRALAFQSTTFDVVDLNGQPWLRAVEIGKALGYADDKAIQRIYARRQDEFTPAMTGVVKVTTLSGAQDARVFSLRGAHLLAMFARTETAKAFRRWVLDVLEQRGNDQPAALPDTFTTKPKQALPASDAHILRSTIDQFAQRVPNERRAVFCIQAWSKLKAHFGTSYRNIPADRFGEALQVVYRHIGEFDGLALPDETAHILRTDTINTLCERLTRQLLGPNGYTLEPFIPLWAAINQKLARRLLPPQPPLALV